MIELTLTTFSVAVRDNGRIAPVQQTMILELYEPYDTQLPDMIASIHKYYGLAAWSLHWGPRLIADSSGQINTLPASCGYTTRSFTKHKD